jgi:hypothetical protein
MSDCLSDAAVTTTLQLRIPVLELLKAVHVLGHVTRGSIATHVLFLQVHPQDRKVSQARNQHEAGSKLYLLHAVIGLFFDPEVTDDVFHRNVC